MVGALEAGGTKMVCAIGNEEGQIFDKKIIKTEKPEETMPAMIHYFQEHRINKLGIGCFGPLDLEKGIITTTPKLDWVNYPIRSVFSDELKIPVMLDTDVNAALLGEVVYGCAKGIKNCVYITIGTGVGMGIMCEGKLVHGMMHPEAGHMLIAKQESDLMEGNCPYHTSCLEGLAAGPAIEKRCGKKGNEISIKDPVWQLEAEYIAQAIVNLIMTISPEKIILGGGVMKQKQLFPMIRKQVKELLGGYIVAREIENLENYIVFPSLDDSQGVLGAIALTNINK